MTDDYASVQDGIHHLKTRLEEAGLKVASVDLATPRDGERMAHILSEAGIYDRGGWIDIDGVALRWPAP